MQDTFTKDELGFLLAPPLLANLDPGVLVIRRALGLVPTDGKNTSEVTSNLQGRGLLAGGIPQGGAAVLVRSAETSTMVRGLATFEETDNDETSHRTSILSGPLGHASLWETPSGQYKLSWSDLAREDPGRKLATALRNLAGQSILEGTFYRNGTVAGSRDRLTEDTSFQFADLGQLGWIWRPDSGQDEMEFHETTLDSLALSVSSTNGQQYPEDLTAPLLLSR